MTKQTEELPVNMYELKTPIKAYGEEFKYVILSNYYTEEPDIVPGVLITPYADSRMRAFEGAITLSVNIDMFSTAKTVAFDINNIDKDVLEQAIPQLQELGIIGDWLCPGYSGFVDNYPVYAFTGKVEIVDDDEE